MVLVWRNWNAVPISPSPWVSETGTRFRFRSSLHPSGGYKDWNAVPDFVGRWLLDFQRIGNLIEPPLPLGSAKPGTRFRILQNPHPSG